MGVGVIVQPCVERVSVIRQNLGKNWSSIYYDNYNLNGYQLVSPVLGLLAYNAGDKRNLTGNPFELEILAGENPITIDFSNYTFRNNIVIRSGIIPLCASFENDGKVILTYQASHHVCVVRRQGHYGLVIESPLVPSRKKVSRWKLVVGSSVGASLGVLLLGLLLVAIFAKVKEKSRREEIERRAYEEEVLQVSMVGHVRAPVAAVTRTVPTLEHEYIPPRS